VKLSIGYRLPFSDLNQIKDRLIGRENFSVSIQYGPPLSRKYFMTYAIDLTLFPQFLTHPDLKVQNPAGDDNQKEKKQHQDRSQPTGELKGVVKVRLRHGPTIDSRFLVPD